MKNNSNRLAIKMLIAMVLGIGVGLGFMALRETLGSGSEVWQTINSILFQDITAVGAESAIGLFYIIGQLFIRSLQLVIVPMVFTSIVLAIGTIRDASPIGRVSLKTFGWFLMTTTIALLQPVHWASSATTAASSPRSSRVLQLPPAPPVPIR